MGNLLLRLKAEVVCGGKQEFKCKSISCVLVLPGTILYEHALADG